LTFQISRRGDRLLERRRKQAQFRDPQVTLDNFDFNFNKKMNRSLVFDLATATFIGRPPPRCTFPSKSWSSWPSSAARSDL
jgi:hypothetical protein